MAGFVAQVPAPATPEGLLVNDGFFPDIDIDNLRAAVRLPGEITIERLSEAAVYAMDACNRELSSYRTKSQTAGYATLAEVPAASIGGESRLVMLYRRAVYSTVKADLTERYRDVDTTATGNKRADDLDPGIDEQRRNARWAVRDILGLPHSTVELI